jgi:hypothetical protein
MTGTIGKTLAANPPVADGSSSTVTRPSSTGARPASHDSKVVVLPAFFVGDLLSKFSGTIGEFAGDVFGNAALGKQVGNAASPLLKLLPFSVVPPSVNPASAGPGGGGGSSETLVVVPAGFIGGLLGGIGGNLLGGAIGDFFGDKDTGANVGKAAGGILGGLLPFQVIPPQIAPQSVGPGGQPTEEPMVVVPAGFFGNLIKGVASTIASISGDSTVQTIANTASSLSDLLPFQDVPPDLVPQSAGPDGKAVDSERLIVVPAGFFGNLLSGLADTVGGAIGGVFGDSQTGAAIGAAAKPLLGLIPFHTVPPELVPQSAGPGGAGGTQQELMVVPAGLFSGLLSTYAGAIGQYGGGFFGNAGLGKQIGDAAAPLIKLLPFSVQDSAPRSAVGG